MIITNEYDLIEDHLKSFWSDRTVTEHRLGYGPIEQHLPRFRVICFHPTKTATYWIYSTLGCWEVDTGHHRLEFFVLSPTAQESCVEMLSMLANYHADPHHRLGLGSIVEIGDPWITGSKCDHLLVSLPYIFGPQLEWLRTADICVRIFWLVPITRKEAAFAQRNSVEELEQIFDKKKIRYLDPQRTSLI